MMKGVEDIETARLDGAGVFAVVLFLGLAFDQRLYVLQLAQFFPSGACREEKA